MAYVVTRPRGRFEIRESVHTPKGPRARSLANFARFTDEVLERARTRASRPFDADAVRAAAQRAAGSADAAATRAAPDAGATVPRHAQTETREFVEASRRMARSLERLPAEADRRDPGDALIGLLEFVALSAESRPPSPREPLRFPLLARLRAARRRGDQGVVSEP
jgi:cytochrome c556